jgi:hypothetical protein
LAGLRKSLRSISYLILSITDRGGRFWLSVLPVLTPNARARFIEGMVGYLKSNITLAQDRKGKVVRTVEGYFPLRRQNFAFRPVSLTVEADLDIPDKVFHHPIVKAVRDVVADMIIIDNVNFWRNLHNSRL